MKIKSLGYKVTDEESGIVFELIPKTEEATQELVEKFLNSQLFRHYNIQFFNHFFLLFGKFLND
jgi:hypothetical protein